jgi:hypothetical protein
VAIHEQAAQTFSLTHRRSDKTFFRNSSAMKTYIQLSTLIFWLSLAGLAVAGEPMSSHMPPRESVCTDCHTCKNPTPENPCTYPCPRPRATAKDLAKGPVTVILNELENEYEGVLFPHRLHAQMSAMGGECADCHHFGDQGQIESCKNCHSLTETTESFRKPGLKGAYHRQCMRCHEEWSGVTDCQMCHAKKNPAGPVSITGSTTPSSQTSYFPPMTQPAKKVWNSSYGGGTVVTLHHANHTDKYGIDCAECHHNEGCGSCHQAKNTTANVSHSEEALHAICNKCHSEMSCDQCHQKSEAAEFSHDRTGFPLKHHARLACRTCHGDPTHFIKPDPDCNNCHANWTNKNFDHSKTGLALNETHKEFDCETCHMKRAFAVRSSCSECHESDVSFPDKLPGTLVKTK